MSSVLSNESALDSAAEAEGPVSSGIPRWIDATIALASLIILSPLIALCAVTVAIMSGLPVFFRQRRVGVNGVTFELVKFRTMKHSQGGPEITQKGDQRITKLGRFLRQTKLDELPTLWNVLRGDMALVGPRPEVPRYVKLDDPLWQAIIKVRPGLTDPVTILLRHEEELLARVEGDSESYYINELQPAKLRGYVEYLQRRTFGSDIAVISRTVAAIFRRH